MSNPLDPEVMSPAERLEEAASLSATADSGQAGEAAERRAYELNSHGRSRAPLFNPHKGMAGLSQPRPQHG